MARKKRKSKRAKQAPTKSQSSPPCHGGEKRSSHLRIGRLLVSLLAAGVVAGALWAQWRQPGSTDAVGAAEETDALEQVVGDVYYVNNRQCAMSDSPIAEKDMGRFESRVVYDGPIEQFQGRTLVFNQCCSMCIDSFPKKWAAERDQIMAKFGLTDADPATARGD